MGEEERVGTAKATTENRIVWSWRQHGRCVSPLMLGDVAEMQIRLGLIRCVNDAKRKTKCACEFTVCVPSTTSNTKYPAQSRSVNLLQIDFVIKRFSMKLFKTNNLETVTYCRKQFNFELLSTVF